MPLVDFTINPTITICPDDVITVTDNSTSTSNPSYTWSTIPSTTTITNSTSNSTDITFPNNNSGTSYFYDIELIFITAEGCQDNSIETVEVTTKPIAEFSITDTSCGGTLTTNNTSSYGNSWLWNVAPSSGVNINNNTDYNTDIDFPINNTSSPITYTVELTAYTTNLCDSSTTQTVTVYPHPEVEFSTNLNNGCDSLDVIFTNTSNPFNGETISLMNFDWTVDGNSFSSSQDTSYIFTNTGIVDSIYTVMLYGTTSHGCLDSFPTTITIHPDPIADTVLLGNMTDCAPLTIDNSLLYAVDYPNANHDYFWILTHTDGTIITGTGIDPPVDEITNDNDTVFIQLIVTNNYGCIADTLNTLIVTIEDPTANFSVNPLQGCSPLTVTTDTSGTTQGVNYTWEVVDDNFNQIQSYNSHQDDFTIYNTSNTLDSNFYIILTVGDPSSGCGHSDTSDLITVFPVPIADISTQNQCDVIEVIFLDNSTPTNVSIISSWDWDFGDTGSTTDISTIEYPLPYIYTTWGQWDITLIITDLNGCSDTDIHTITIWPNPTANFDTSYACFPDSICSNDITSFLDNSTINPLGGNLITGYWYLNPPIGSPSYTSFPYTNQYSDNFPSGLQTIEYIIESEYGCLDTISNTIQVVDVPIASFEIEDSICVNDPPLFVITNLSSGYILDYYWEITDSIGLTVWDSTLQNNTIPTFPVLDQGFAPITYYIYLTVSNCCGDSTYMDSIVITPTPQGWFYSIYCDNAIDLPIGLPITLEYDNISFWNPTNTDTLIIDWGDMSPNDTVLPDCGPPNSSVCWEELSHIYNTIGNYTICMTGINQCGDSTYCCDINVSLNNIASSFQVIPTSNYNCIGDSTKFIELSSNSYPNATVNWWFDYTLNTNSNGDTIPPSSTPDESRIYTQNEIVSYLYSDPGVYLVFHNITSPWPNQYTDWNVNWNDTVFVFPKPDISFTSDNVCIYTPITFINNSTIDNTIIGMPSQNINSAKWYIDNILVSNTFSLTHTFTSPGQKWIKLESWSNFNCYNVDSILIDVYDQPVPNLITTSHCEGNETFIDATSSSGSVLYSSVMDTFCWDLNGISGIDSCNTSGHLNFTFPAGNNTISLILTDNLGCSDTFESTIYITPDITTDFSFDDSICSGELVIFTNLSSPYADDYLWDFGFIGSNSNSTLEHPETVFPSGGQHFVITLTTYNIISAIETCEATFTDSIYIWNKPEAIFSALPVCANETTFINNNSINTGVNIIENKWEFSDSPTYEYNNSTIVPHIFNVNELLGEITWAKLLISDENGCRDSVVNPISIHPLPEVDFSVPPICEGDVLIAEDNSTMFVGNAFPSDNITTGNWMFNNNINITSNDLPIWDTHVPTQPHGNYPISLTINTSFPCSNSTQKLLTILEIPKVSSFNPNNFTPNQCGDSIIFHLDGNFQADEWQYVFDNSHPYCWESILPNVTNIDYLLCQPHNYQLNITLENYNGCKDTAIYNLHTYPNPIANYSSLPNHGCEDLEVIFTDNSTINNDLTYHSFPENEPSFLTNYNWTFGDLSPTIYNLDNTSITHTYSTNNGEKISYIPSLSVETNHYCVNTYFYDSITIFPTPKAELFQPIAEGFGLYQFDGSTSTTSLNSSLYAVTNNYNFTWILGSNGNNTEGIDTISSQHYPYGEHLNNNIIDYKYESNSLHQGGHNYDVYLIVTLKEIPNCSDTTMISHKVEYWKGLFVPNALSADINNGEAALFWPKGKSLSEYFLQVYDIWGNIIWESQDLDLTGKPTKESAWDGSINGIPAPQGTYIWKIYGKFSDGTIWLNEEGENTGPIYLIR